MVGNAIKLSNFREAAAKSKMSLRSSADDVKSKSKLNFGKERGSIVVKKLNSDENKTNDKSGYQNVECNDASPNDQRGSPEVGNIPNINVRDGLTPSILSKDHRSPPSVHSRDRRGTLDSRKLSRK